MKNGDFPAMPVKQDPSNDVIAQRKGLGLPVPATVTYPGLTKREHFAAMAMQGMTWMAPEMTHRDVADHAVKYADALLAALEGET